MSLKILTAALEMAFQNEEYSFCLEAESHPKRNVKWSVDKDTPLPWGLTLSADGVISGVPSRVQRTSVNITASAEEPPETDRKILNINVYEQLTIVTESIPKVPMNTVFGLNLKAKGGVPPYSWSCDSLPIGLRLENGSISGQPTVSGGVTPILITAKDSVGKEKSKVFVIKII